MEVDGSDHFPFMDAWDIYWGYIPINPLILTRLTLREPSRGTIDSRFAEALGAEKQTLEILSESLKIVNQYNVTWLKKCKKYDLGRSSFLGKTEVENMYRWNLCHEVWEYMTNLSLSPCEFM